MARLREPAVNGVEHEPTATVPLDVQEFDRLRSEPAPWSTPTVEEVPWDTLPTEMRMLVLGLPDAADVSAPDLAPEVAPVAALETFRVSHPDAARYAVVLQNMREQRGDAAANAEMVWELGNTAMVPPGEIQRELERIQRLAGPSVHRRAPLDPTNTMEKR